MSEVVEAVPETPVAVPGPRRTLQVLRISTVLHSLAIILQPTLAGLYLSGDVGAIGTHELNGNIVTGLGLIQLGAAIAFAWRGRGQRWPLWGTLAIAVIEELQIGFGYSGMLAVHVPLGVSLITTQVLLTVWLFRAAAATPRRRSA